MGGDDDDAPGPDDRVFWLQNRVQNALRLKADKLKGFNAGTSREALVDFLDSPSVRRVVVVNGLAVSKPPEGLKKKAVFFLKLDQEKITMENIDALVISGDLAENPLQHFNLVSEQVFVPLLTKTSVAKRWPAALTNEVMANFYRLINDMQVTIGMTEGTTKLPLPPPEGSTGGLEEHKRSAELETSVMAWTKQIKNILRADPESALKSGKHVGPDVEIEFWNFKSENLKAIHEQLEGEQIQQVVEVLTDAKSPLTPTFKRLCEDVKSAMDEAVNNVVFLAPLISNLTKLRDNDDFEELINLFQPIMHTIMLIWKHSKYYNSPSRLVVLMREICNDLIDQARKFVFPEEILEEEPQDAVDKLKTTLRVCGMLKTAYFSYKTRVSVDCPDRQWRFQNSALFMRLDSFLERCHDILELLSTKLQYIKLEKIEVGGTKGKVLTTSVAQIYIDFLKAIAKFDDIRYDILDVEAKEFDDDFYEFRVAIKEMERRLGAVVTQAFDDCTTVYGSFKLLDSFDTLLEREVIMQDLEKKHLDLVRNFSTDLKTVLDIFNLHKDKPVIGRNMPPVSGAVLWVRGLQERIEDPFERFQTLHASAIMGTDETKETFKLYENAKGTFKAYETTQFDTWCKSIESVGQEKLKQPLLIQYMDGGFDGQGKGLPLLRVNFDAALVKLLREVKYFRLMNLEVPQSAMGIYQKTEIFRQQTGNLELIVNIYNRILLTLQDVEKPMLEQRLSKIDDELQKGLKFLTWKSHGINEFITTTMNLVKESSAILSSINGNVSEMKSLLDALKANLMFERKDVKTYAIDEFQVAHETLVGTRHAEAITAGEKLHKLVLASNKVLKISKGAAAWKAYVDFLGGIVVDGLSEAVQASMSSLLDNLDTEYLTRHDMSPLLEIKLELVGPNIEFTPSVDSKMGNELRVSVNAWIKDFMNMAKFVARLDSTSSEGDYLMEIEEDEDIMMQICKVSNKLTHTEEQCVDFMDTFRTFEYLWVKDIEECFQEFMLLAEQEGTEPTLEQFNAEINKYKAIQEEVSQLPNSKSISWLRIDAKPIKQALSTWVSKWSYRYTQHLLDRVTNRVAELLEFMETARETLETEVLDGDVDVLIHVMACIRDVRTRTDETDNMFEPFRATVSLLKKWDIEVTEETQNGLEEAPMAWGNLKKQTFQVKEKLTPLQNAEATKVKKDVEDFTVTVEEFRASFKEKGPFAYTEKYADCFVALGTYAEEITKLEERAAHLNEMQDLFDLTVYDYRDIRNSRKDIRMLKHCWDTVALVTTTFELYKQIKWDDIFVETLVSECKNLMKTVKSLDKYTKNWSCYKGVEDAVKNMMTALPLVEELKNPSMRDRHWKQLMRATGKSFTMDKNFSLGDLLSLNLFDYVDAVSEIVDRAQKELTIEKQLTKLEEIWAVLNLDFVPYGETEVMLVQASEELIEALDDSQVQLQNLGGSKYVAGNQQFQEMVNAWQSKLGAVDQTVRTVWLEVQNKWVGLEPIFIGSADIRVQLPEDSKRFDGTDGQWKELMKEAVDQTNAVEAAQVDGRLELLESMLVDLELCEKSLADYLETKRLAFPRFYFVAPADLLDILSKGSMPWLLQKHFSKNFDSIQSLNFEAEAPSKTALGMTSPQGEYVEFHEPLVCDGAVETWLNKIMEWMRVSLKTIMLSATKTYDDKPREQWLFDYCYQLVTLVSRIAYTEEMNLVFDSLEEGNESALKDFFDKQQDQLNKLSDLINGELAKGDRKKIIGLVTTDVHARDVITRLINDRVESIGCFQWQSQLRYFIDEKTQDCKINVADFSARYSYEYIGNCGCLVITPLTDRCYITLTQASRLILGGAPAGPAGTGKTETVKDLGRALGVMVYVFNCSDQMDFRSMAQIYKGLAQTGCWGCFDEFNRISIEVLSVCSTQYKTVLDGIRATEGAEKPRFVFDEEDIPLVRTTMAFITMNPGYAGRTELPESLKALFRPVSMVVPDMNLITEIMLFAEGFKEGKILSRKFMLCYNLATDLLSKSDHYDWKLRAVKTTLNVAGSMKRAAPELSEDKVVLRALRDFNIGKLLGDDVGIFMGLLNDLFPKTLELVPRQRFPDFEEAIKKACVDKGHQPEENVVLKISQLREIFQVRWSVFLLGIAGCAKTVIWQTLLNAQNAVGEKGTCATLNPKGVTRNELYGYISMATREWKDGLLSQIFRDFSNNTSYQHEWIVLDGDIDAEWIESMNTVMDDNKLLTLASNERIPLTAPMRLLFEIGDLRNASPATVSRAGVIFVNEEDIGYMPFVYTWLDNREDENEKATLVKMFDKYVPVTLDILRKQFKTTVPIVKINMVCTLCYLLDGLMGNGEGKSEYDEQQIEFAFVFASIWAFGGCLLTDKAKDYRDAFSKWWCDEFKTVKFPEEGQVYDYCVDIKGSKLESWTTDGYVHMPGQPIGSLYVDTSETARITYMLNLLQENHRMAMLVGNAGTGKTAIMRNKLLNLDGDNYKLCFVNLNSFTDSMTLQMIMEQQLEKKAGIVFGPPGNTTLVFFVDDLNMPMLDKYGTQQPIALLRQYCDYSMWYERAKLGPRKIKNCDLMACMNPTSGSFTIQPRLQRHFATFSCQLPQMSSLKTIYESIFVNGHLSDFESDAKEVGELIVSAAVELQTKVAGTFLPSAVKFHYLFNLRDISNVFGGMLRSSASFFSDKLKLIQLYQHEAARVYRDRLISQADFDRFDNIMEEFNKKFFSTVEDYQTLTELETNIFTDFCSGNDADYPPYLPVRDFAQLNKVLEAQLAEHNETNAAMNLVLFTDAMEHISRIARIIRQPRGNALLVGVGGSGKQSLSKLAAFICKYEVFSITVTSSYKVADFKENLQAIYTKAGVKGIGVLFLFTDQQIIDEAFLVLLNDMLSSGDIPDLFPPEEVDNISNAIRSEVKQAGLMDTKEVVWEFFIEKVRKYLHLALCFSPVGDKFRVRARQFPALVSCTQIDWFHPWSQEALVAVAQRFLNDVEGWSDELKENMANHMAAVHAAVTDASAAYLATERRRNYTTPKSFLELIALYKNMLDRKLEEIGKLKERLESGLEKLQATAEMVAELQEALKNDMALVEEKKAATDALLVHVGQETEIANGEKEKASVEEDKASAIAEEVSAFQAEADRELAAAEPIIQAAEEALNSLTKASLTELKAFGSPADDVVMVTAACLVLTEKEGKGTKVPKDLSWAAAKKMMGNVDKFLQSLVAFDKDNLSEILCEACETKFLSNENFTPEVIKTKSGAAAGLCSWCINICKYFRIYQMVAPKRASLAEANAKLDGANTKLAQIKKKLDELDAKLDELRNKFEQATEEKNNAIAQAEASQKKADLADRLVNGLADEGVRWKANIEEFAVRENTMIGDVMLASSFVSYVGAFNATFRNLLVKEKWTPDLVERQIPMTDSVDPVTVLCTEADQAGWANQKLPSDEISIQNGAIITNCERWPLMIDPQLQGIGWILEREAAKELRVVQLSTPKYLDQVEFAIQNGEPVIIENMGESIDAVLDPILQRALIKKGRSLCIKLGDKEVDYDSNFKLYLQTKLANPHYIPEVQAQCTMVNFTVTERGLEDQLLALVVDKERPDLEAQRAELIRAENEFKVTLSQLEDNLLYRLASAEGDILEDIALVENLEETKRTSLEIQQKVREGKETAVAINEAREVYRPVAARGSLLFFLVDKLNALEHMYQFSMANFVDILNKGIDLTEASDELKKRIDSMVDVSCFTVFAYVASGLFEKHKLIFASQLCFKILQQRGEMDMAAFDFLLRAPMEQADNPCEEWLPNPNWYMVKALENSLEQFANLSGDMEGSAKRWREFAENPRAETEPLPGDWKRLPGFDRLLVIRCVRPDRMTEAMRMFVSDIIGAKYIVSQAFNLEKSFEDTRPDVPIFFFLSPGVDVMSTVEQLHKKMGLQEPIATVSLGQGQEPVAERAIDAGHKSGGWVALQNIHLTPNWTKDRLEKRLDTLAEGANPGFRLFLSAEPSLAIPISILQACVKLSNEPPDGMQANLKRSMNYFNDEMLEECSKQAEFKSITFGLCYFHAVLLQRKKFGSIGWNFVYPFSTGDLVNSAQTAVNYLENNSNVPWDDLRYLFGEILYGGHVFNDWDRRLVKTYLDVWMNQHILESLNFFPGFSSPAPTNMKGYNEYIDEVFPPESPACFGLHTNAEIGFRLAQAQALFSSIQDLQPKSAGGEGAMSREDKSKMVLDDVLEKLPPLFDWIDIQEKLGNDERTPFTNVFLQEIERMNVLLGVLKTSLFELDLGLKGDLTISDAMEVLMDALFLDRVPATWEKKAYPSLRPLGSWIADVLERANQLANWTGDMSIPKVTWFPGFFNPQSFLTAVQQSTARRNEWALDKTVVVTDVTKKRDPDEMDSASRDGAYVCGLTLEGCRWDDKIGSLADSFPKELFAPMPVMLLKAVTVDKAEQKDVYECPVYKTKLRPKGALGHPDGGYVFTAPLKTKQPAAKWIMAGVALLNDIS